MSAHGLNDEDDQFDNDTGLDALDFDTPEFAEAESDLDALAGYESDGDARDDDGLDAIHEDYTDHEIELDVDDGFGAVDFDDTSEDDVQIPMVQVANPPGTVTVTALLGGSVAQVGLDPKVTELTEAELAAEVRFVAGVAAKKASAIVHVGVVDMLVEQGMSLRDARDFVETNMPFSTPEEAGEADLELIARHAEQPQ
ncbi:hypothetical protein M2272_004864 [Mycobacterium frederiksbergense]|uniref:YbaB/EbfC family DNA-binding protein n=1 Tax=Mycolicibacterium frederiksbergense TaxID=117567 RepID=A0ABT6L780_9MYCO|nr:hypothetical protein [Mycolicibacterium frederiksbergense]MDH6198205.1 hypothetical protein [Mycolicibacterium frederiksbergense]